MAHEIADLTATVLLARYAAKTLSPVEATRAALDRIASQNGAVNAFCLVDEERALDAARASEARWMRGEPLGLVDGVPCSIKDLILTKGWPTLRGSLTISPDQPWEEDAPCVARLLAHGAVLLGKTATPEYGWKGVTDSPLTGITRNPWDLAKTPGGSSGGAAVAAALGMGALHIGTDGGGSIRIPASFTGIVGIKPTFGRVPAYPASPFGDVAHVGPMTRSVADAALMLRVIAEPDARDWQALPFPPPDYGAGLGDGVKGLRIGFSPDLGFARVDPEVAAAVEKAVAAFETLGATVAPAGIVLNDAHGIFSAHWMSGAAALGTRIPPEQLEKIDPGLKRAMAHGASLSLADYFAGAAGRARLGLTLSTAFERFDLLATPAMPIPAFAAGQETPTPGEWNWTDWSPFTYPFNLSQQPAMSVPCGFTEAGLPIGLQIVGPRLSEALVLRAAAAFETAMPVRLPPMPVG
ncbi:MULTISPECIES: amidase [Rhodomicrobium]|uniref:amidase n=1 Tax=Rhodomicrobium TaxID=1068 RepID=UPI001FD9E441|nr:MULTISPECIES: amidase [Rhodomicrobium]